METEECPVCFSVRPPVNYQLQSDPGWAECTACLERCAPEDSACHICGGVLQRIETDVPPDLSVFDLADDDPAVAYDGDLVQEWCLTCDQDERACQCSWDDSLPLAEVADMVWEEGEEVYDPSGMCDTCIFAFTSHCQPFKEWMQSWYAANVDPSAELKTELQTITGCENYRRS